eukprot:7724450-Pyramimonas_sp.AAC.1
MAPKSPKRPPGNPNQDPEQPTEAPQRHPRRRKALQDDPLLAWASFLDGLVGMREASRIDTLPRSIIPKQRC